MLRACVIALLLVGCERRATDEKPPPEPPRDARVVDAFVDDARAAVLDRLYTYVTTTPRKRSPVEAPVELTGAYLDWMFAYGYARVGKVDRARELVATAKKALADVVADPIHVALSQMFEARVAAALHGNPRAPLLPAADARLGLLDRVGRYKVDRLREHSRILSAGEAIDAIGAFASRRMDHRGSQFDALRGVSDRLQREKIVTAAFDQVTDAKDVDRGPLVEGLIDECIVLRAGALIDKARDAVDALPETARGTAAAKLIVLAHVAAPVKLPELGTKLAPSIAADPSREAALATLVRAKLPRDVLTSIWSVVEARGDKGGAALPARIAFAAGLVQLGDARGTPMLAELAAVTPETLVDRIARIRLLALAYAQLPAGEGFVQIEALAKSWPDATDSFGTNSHYALYPLTIVDALVVALVDE